MYWDLKKTNVVRTCIIIMVVDLRGLVFNTDQIVIRFMGVISRFRQFSSTIYYMKGDPSSDVPKVFWYHEINSKSICRTRTPLQSTIYSMNSDKRNKTEFIFRFPAWKSQWALISCLGSSGQYVRMVLVVSSYVVIYATSRRGAFKSTTSKE